MRVVYFILFIMMSSAYADENLPLDLSRVANRHGCASVPGFFDRPGMVDPPYVYGLLRGNKEDSAVFWCRSKSDVKKYKLIVVVAEDLQYGCNREIETENYPGGLSLVQANSESIKGFRDRFEHEPLPATAVNGGNIIVSYYDGVESSFFCYEGAWYVRIRH